MKLNLGSGNILKEGYINVDFYNPKADMKFDLFTFPWPWEDNSVDEVTMDAFLEHYREPQDAVNEIARILKVGGKFKMWVSHCYQPLHYHFDHRSYYTSQTFRALSEPMGEWIWKDNKPPFRQTYFRMKWVTVAGMCTWTPLDWWLTKFPHFFEKFIPIRPSCIIWEGVKV